METSMSQALPAVEQGFSSNKQKCYSQAGNGSPAQHSQQLQSPPDTPLRSDFPADLTPAANQRSRLGCATLTPGDHLSLVVKLKVNSSTMAVLQSDECRQSRRERRPTEKMRQHNEIPCDQDPFSDSPVNVGTVVQETSHTKPARSKRPKGRPAKARRRRGQPPEDDAEYNPRSRTTNRKGGMATTNAGMSTEDVPQKVMGVDDIEQSDSRVRDLTLDDFEPPTPYGFPLRVIRSEAQRDDGSVPINSQPSHHATLRESLIDDLESLRMQCNNNTLPNTPEFWSDWFIAEQARKSQNLDFKMICLNMIKLRDKFSVPTPTIENPLSQGAKYFFGHRIDRTDHQDSLSEPFPRLRDVLPPYGTCLRKDPDDASILLTYTDWDVLLASIKVARKEMHSRRRWKLKGKYNEAGWAVWETKMRRDSRGSFVEESEVDLVDTASANAESLEGTTQVQPLSLGYRRRGVRDGNGFLSHRMGSHWEATGVDQDRAASTSSAQEHIGGNTAQVLRFMRINVRENGLDKEAVEDSVDPADTPYDGSKHDVRRKLFE